MNRVVLLTGGTSGIGLAAARLFLQAGCTVALAGRSAAHGEAALASLGGLAADGCAAFFAADLRRADEARRLVDAVRARFSRLDVLVNSAGVYLERALEDLTEEEFDDVMDTNVKGTFFTTQAALAALKESRGNIVNLSSDAGLHGNFLCTAYCASKGAVMLFTKSLALELARELRVPRGCRYADDRGAAARCARPRRGAAADGGRLSARSDCAGGRGRRHYFFSGFRRSIFCDGRGVERGWRPYGLTSQRERTLVLLYLLLACAKIEGMTKENCLTISFLTMREGRSCRLAAI